jgi:hypothetical protein
MNPGSTSASATWAPIHPRFSGGHRYGALLKLRAPGAKSPLREESPGMSTLAYAAITRKREEAKPGTSTTAPPGLSNYVDVLAALVPAEVLSAHAVLISFSTTITKSAGGGTTTTITDANTLRGVFAALVVLSVVLYVGAHTRTYWDPLDFVRVLIPPLAFVGWTMLQKATAFDAVAPGLQPAPRFSIGVLGALILALLAARLSYAADQKTPPGAAVVAHGQPVPPKENPVTRPQM